MATKSPPDPTPEADPPAPDPEAATPAIRTGRVSLHYVGQHGAYTFDLDGGQVPARDMDGAEVKARLRTKRRVQAVVDTQLYELVIAADEVDDLPDDETPAPRRGG